MAFASDLVACARLDFAEVRRSRWLAFTLTAYAALAALFDPATREAGEVQKHPPAASPAAARPVSKRDFLFGAGKAPGRGAHDEP